MGRAEYREGLRAKGFFRVGRSAFVAFPYLPRLCFPCGTRSILCVGWGKKKRNFCRTIHQQQRVSWAREYGSKGKTGESTAATTVFPFASFIQGRADEKDYMHTVGVEIVAAQLELSSCHNNYGLKISSSHNIGLIISGLKRNITLPCHVDGMAEAKQ